MIPWRRVPELLIARRNLTRTKARSALAMLGIVIGVIAIAALGMFGATLQTALVGSLGDIGNEVIVSPATSEGVEFLDDRDIREIERVADGATVVPIKQTQGLVTYGGERTFTTIYGIENPGATFTASSGRIPEPFRNGALVGSVVADNLGVREGNAIQVGNRTYRVRAILETETGIALVNPGTAVVVPARDIDQPGSP